MTIDKATIINWALVDIGAGPVFSVDDGSDLSEQCENSWQRCVDEVFGMHDWSFARKTYRNVRHAETPENGWHYGFDLPGNRIGPPLKVMDQAGSSPRPLREYALEEGMLFCNQSETWSLCKVAVAPDAWEPPFRAAFVIALAGYLAIPIWFDEDLRDAKLAEAFGSPSQQGGGGKLGRLMAQDRAGAPVGQTQADDEPLTAARTTGAGPIHTPWHGDF
ncbi:hypothetical protein [Martelella sp. FOR1707]